jgi:hypothetical protein
MKYNTTHTPPIQATLFSLQHRYHHRERFCRYIQKSHIPAHCRLKGKKNTLQYYDSAVIEFQHHQIIATSLDNCLHLVDTKNKQDDEKQRAWRGAARG